MAGKKQKMIYGILSLLCFAVLLAAGVSGGKKKQQQEPASAQAYDMVVLGDSILGQIRDETAIPYQVGEALGMNVFNGALGGTCMGRLAENPYSGNIKDALSLASISKSVAAGDFRTQKLVRLTENGTAHFPDVIEELSQIDFSQVELLLIGYGVNDYHAGEVIAEEENPYDEYTYTGAMRSAILTLKNAYPHMRIVLVTPPYTWYTDIELTCEEYVRGGNILKDYVNAEIHLAQELEIEIIDLYHGLYPHDTWEDWKLYSADGLHPNEEGRNLISQAIIEHFVQHPLGD